jgi:hypothetical protein
MNQFQEQCSQRASCKVMALSEGLDSSGSQSYLREWMNERTSTSQPKSPHSTADSERGFLLTFYHECLQLLSEVWKGWRRRLVGASRRQLQESLTRFLLWGSGWEEGRLDFCLNGSLEVRGNVTDLLSSLAKASIQGTCL